MNKMRRRLTVWVSCVAMTIAGRAVAADDLADCLASQERSCLVRLATDAAAAVVDPWAQVSGFMSLALRLFETGDGGGAHTAMASAIAADARRLGLIDRDDARLALAWAYSRIGDFAAALAQAEAIANSRNRAIVSGVIVAGAVEMGDLVLAESLLGRLDPEWAADVQYQLARAYGEQDDWLRATAFARAIRPDWRGNLVAWMVRHLSDLGRTHEAIRLALDLADGRELDAAMAEAVVSMAARGFLGDAQILAEAIQYVGARDTAFAAMALAYATSQSLDAAAKAAAEVRVPSARRALGADLAGLQARRGDVDGALALAASAQDPDERAQRYGAIALVQTAGGDITGALATAARIEDHGDRSILVGDLAAARLNAGDFDAARAVLDSLTGSAAFARSLYLTVLRDAVVGYARAGDPDRAITLAQGVENSFDRTWLFLRVAAAISTSAPADARRFLSLAEWGLLGPTEGYDRDNLVRQLAVEFAGLGDTSHAATLLNGMNPETRLKALLNLIPPVRNPG